MKTFNDYIKSRNGVMALANYALDEVGIYFVRGEELESGMGRDLGYFEGTLRDVIEFTIQLPNFWSYGDGGIITKIKAKRVDKASMKMEKSLRARKEQIENALKVINDQLNA